MQAYIVLSLFAAVGFTLSNLITKFTSKHAIENSWVLLLYSYLSVLPFIIFLPLFKPISFPSGPVWVFIVLFAVIHVVGKAFFAKAVYRLDASTFAPFFQLQSAFIAVLAYLFLAEQFPPIQYLFITLILLGAILVSLDERMHIKTFLSLATALILTQQFLHAVANMFAGFAVKGIDSFSFTFWAALTTCVVVLPMIPALGSKAKITGRQLKPLLLSSFCSTAAIIALFTAYQTNVTVSSALALLTAPIVLVLTFIASAFWPELLEHHKPQIYLIRAIGVAIILFGAYQLSIH